MPRDVSALHGPGGVTGSDAVDMAPMFNRVGLPMASLPGLMGGRRWGFVQWDPQISSLPGWTGQGKVVQSPSFEVCKTRLSKVLSNLL